MILYKNILIILKSLYNKQYLDYEDVPDNIQFINGRHTNNNEHLTINEGNYPIIVWDCI